MILELNSFHIFLNNYKLIFFVPKYFQKKKKFITHFQLTSPPYNVKSLETCQYSKSPIKSPRKRKHVASPGGSMGGGGRGHDRTGRKQIPGKNCRPGPDEEGRASNYPLQFHRSSAREPQRAPVSTSCPWKFLIVEAERDVSPRPANSN